MEGKIYQAIINVMGDLGAIGKEKKNTQQGFMYRGVDDVMNALQPLFKKYGIFIVPEVLEHTREERTTKSGGNLIYSIMKIRHHFMAEDGSEVVSTTIGEGMDSADKSSNKAMAIAFKYACFQVFCIPTEEMPDPDANTPPDSSANGSPSTTDSKPPKKTAKKDDEPAPFKRLTRDEMLRVYGESHVEEMIVYFEGKFGVEMANWDEEYTELARAKLAERKAKREAEAKRKAGMERIDDRDIPFPIGDR